MLTLANGLIDFVIWHRLLHFFILESPHSVFSFKVVFGIYIPYLLEARLLVHAN